MLILPSGAVIPFVGVNPIADHITVHQMARYDFRKHVTLDTIIEWCWACGFSAYDTNLVCSVNGYALCVAELRRRQVFQHMDEGYAVYQAQCEDEQKHAELSPFGYNEQF